MRGFHSREGGQLVLVITGVWWCIVAIRRLPDDWDLWRKPIAPEQRSAIAIYWVLTLIVAAVTVTLGTHTLLFYADLIPSLLRA